jgi:glycogen debranching enzyme
MKDEGFEVSIYLDELTGILKGGNRSNCGTWMDKMGSASGVNKGTPATPRDGAPVELVGLLYSGLKFAEEIFEKRNCLEGVSKVKT